MFVSIAIASAQQGIHKRNVGSADDIAHVYPGSHDARNLVWKTDSLGISQDFESLQDFSLDFTPWTTIDNDSSDTYGFAGISFPHRYDTMAFIVFNPAQTDPSMENDPDIQPHGGDKFAACFSSVFPNTNDDWIISPQIVLGKNASLTFWVKSYTAEFGLEKYKVGVSTGGNNPGAFQIISGPTPLEAPATAWEKKQFSLSQFDSLAVYIGIQCVSEDAFVFMLDDIVVESQMLGIGENKSINLNIFPNPASEYLTIESDDLMELCSIYSYAGECIHSQQVNDTKLILDLSGYTVGIYLIDVLSGEKRYTAKVFVRR